MNEQQQSPPPKSNDYVLAATLKELDYTYFYVRDDDIPELLSKSAISMAISLDDIADACVQKDNKELEIQVLTEMKFPVIITHNTKDEYRKAIRGLSNLAPYDINKPFLAIIGNQRVKIARDNGFSHIDAFLVDTGKEALVIKKIYDNNNK